MRTSITDKWFLGVLGGMGEYFGIDPIWLRLGFILLAFNLCGSSLWIGYLIAYFIMDH